jgi:acyl-coenzyme A thioesterase PaaI-like protein
LTVDYTVKLLAPAKGEKIVARGRVIKPSQVMTVAAADVYAVDGGDEKLCATAFVTMRNIKLAKD